MLGGVCEGNRSGYTARVAFSGWPVRILDRVLYRHPFEGASARRYERLEHPAFGDLDERLLDALAPQLAGARRLLDLGAGPATFSAAASRRHPRLSVLAVDPSRDFARPRDGVTVVRARGEALPLADGSVDVALCLSSIRHVRDRAQALRELRRVVVDRLWIVELDPAASAARIGNHADHLGSRILRRAFGPLVVRTAPSIDQIASLARDAGWRVLARRDDAIQPVYILELA